MVPLPLARLMSPVLPFSEVAIACRPTAPAALAAWMMPPVLLTLIAPAPAAPVVLSRLEQLRQQKGEAPKN